MVGLYPFCLAWLPLSAAALQLLPPLERLDQVHGAFNFSSILAARTVYIEKSFVDTKDTNGLTLIPPSARDFACTFVKDLSALTGSDWSLSEVSDFSKAHAGIFLGQYTGKESLKYENGHATEEGYEIIATEDGTIFIHGSGALGIFWGTRTILQQVLIDKNQQASNLPIGVRRDAPAYPTRGYMLDAGRKWYSPGFLKELCTYASFYKMNEFHYHAADNYPLNRGHNETWQQVYSQFALLPEDPDLQGLVQRQNETLSPTELEDLQQHCASYGVAVVVEIEAPGHALSITKWKPELALERKKDLLNLTHPDTVPLVKEMWADFLPRLHTKEIHIGADEYDATLADNYIDFVNEMSVFVRETSDKRIRIWGTYEPSPTNKTISKDVIIQHWQYGQSDPVQSVQDGYEIINSDDKWAYMSIKNDHVPISPAPYAQFFNESKVLNFGGQQGQQWEPSLVNFVNATMQLKPGEKFNKGAIMASWNDNGPDASTQLEYYYAIRRGVPLVASRAWSGQRGPEVDVSSLDDTIDFFSQKVPNTNLDRVLSTTLNSDLTQGILIDWSGDAISAPVDLTSLANGSHDLTGSKGLNYTLSIKATGPFNVTGRDTTLSLNDDGKLVFATVDGWPYPLRSTDYNESSFFPDSPGQGRIWGSPKPGNMTASTHEEIVIDIPSGSDVINIDITGDALRGARCWIDGGFVGRFEVLIWGGRNTYTSWSQMALVAPTGVLEGGVVEFMVRDGVYEP